jgi:hypothetical protein
VRRLALLLVLLIVTGAPAAVRAERVRALRYHVRAGELGFVREATDQDPEVELAWDTDRIELTPAAAGTPDIDGEDQVLAQVVAHWTAATARCGDGPTLVVGASGDGEVGYDRVNRVVYRHDRWCSPVLCDEPIETCYDGTAAAITTLCYGETSGRILDADIELNAVDFAIGVCRAAGHCTTAGAGFAVSDLANTMTHEIGHLFGLAHTCWSDADEPQPVDHRGRPAPDCHDEAALTAEMREATMFAFQGDGEVKKATLEADDVDGFCAIYEGGCGCGFSDRRPGARGMAPLLAGLALFLWARRRA